MDLKLKCFLIYFIIYFSDIILKKINLLDFVQ